VTIAVILNVERGTFQVHEVATPTAEPQDLTAKYEMEVVKDGDKIRAISLKLKEPCG